MKTKQKRSAPPATEKSDVIKCGFCGQGDEIVPECGALHCEVVAGRRVAAHHKCMQYSALLIQYKIAHFGGFKIEKVIKELSRGSRLGCSLCKKKGASSGCAWASCKKSFHFPCAFNNDSAVTKRYKVQSGTKTVILYRVFCSGDHEQKYRQNIQVSGIGKSSPAKEKVPKSEINGERSVTKSEVSGKGSPVKSEKNGKSFPDEKSETTGKSTPVRSDIPGKRLGPKIAKSAEPESKKRKRDVEPSDSEQDGVMSQESDLDMNDLSRVSADLNNTASSLLSSPEMTVDEVLEQTQREYALLKAKSKKIEENGGKKTQFDLSNSLSPEASDIDEDHSDDVIIGKTENVADLLSKDSEVALLIPSLLQYPDQELADVQRELDITAEQSVVWPPINAASSVQEKYLPHIMWNIVNTIKNESVGKLSSILHNVSQEKYDYFLEFHSEQNDNVNQQVFHSIAEKLAIMNRKSTKKIGQLVSRKYQKMKFLVLFLSPRLPDHGSLIMDLRSNINIFHCSRGTNFKNMYSQARDSETEWKRLWRWFKSKLTSKFQFDTCPVEETFISEKNSSMVAEKIIHKLSSLQQCSSFGSNTALAVLVIDGANRDVVKFKSFVQTVIDRFVANSLSDEIFFLISIDKSDQIQVIDDIVPAHLVTDAKVYSAFNPEKACLSCIVLYIKKGDTTQPDPGAKKIPSPSSPERKQPSRSSKSSPLSQTSPIVVLSKSDVCLK